ncbi:MAG: T9SS type A sorting domain-containing protein [Candidatus Krumholzibacteria bacterium]|nr:T9SS type A sorting domain-containing protein [Candidatus Krumholzibacteria bacterium]
MRTLCSLALCVCLVATLTGPGLARDAAKPGLRIAREWSGENADETVDPGLRALYESAAVDTYCLVWYDFEQYDWQGWTRVDNTAQPGDFFHVDDFNGLSGGSYGGLVPIEGTKSMWCGARPNSTDQYLCSWEDAPGYGNGWNQWLTTDAISFSGAIYLSYHIVWDSEPEYDYTRVEYDAGNDSWQELIAYTGTGDTVASHLIAIPRMRTKLRFHFTADGAWSDQDGLYNTDGGCIIDSIRVTDSGGLDNFENFESAAVGAHVAGIWLGQGHPGFGNYSGLKNNLTDKDPCGENYATQIVFFLGSPNPSSSYPGLYDTPFCAGPGGITSPCQYEEVLSPLIDMTKYSTARNEIQDGTIPPGDLPLLGGCKFRFTVYRDLPLANLVFYQWHVRNIIDGCPGQWQDREFVYYGPDMDYIQSVNYIGDFITGDPLRISLNVIDMCDVWYLVNGNCDMHTPSPWFDNVAIYRYKTSGPQWSYRDLDFFQDNFPELEFTLESYVRADAANDIRNNDDPGIDPGDSIVLDCTSPLGGGIAADATFGGPAVYIHVKASYIGPAPSKPALHGAALAGSVVTGPIGAPVTVDFNYVSDDGTWTIIQCDTTRTGWGIQRDRYMVDLNDELFTRGYLIEYYFTARDGNGEESALPRYARSGPPFFEWTCLPTKNSYILFVDDFTGRGSFAGSAENYWMPVFDTVLPHPNDSVDKYDVNGPSSGVSNGPGSRAKTQHLVDWYHYIVWDCGDLESITISDGTVNSDKSDDCTMLINWFEQSEHVCGLWVCGDGVAFDLDGLASTPALTLMSSWCGVDFAATSYFDETGGRTGGGIVTPLITGEADAGIFVHTGVPDKFYAFGGCPIVNKFDVLDKTANGKYALSYPVYNAANRYAAIASSQMNPSGYHVNTMWFGFSYQYVRDDVVWAPLDRFELAKNVFSWMQTVVLPNIVPAEAPPKFTTLAQNFPNPFNPSTTIKFDLKEKGLVTLKVYNVAGQLVRTLVNEVRDAAAYSIPWDGTNDRGGAVASGIYFYKMETKSFNQTRKMVLLR